MSIYRDPASWMARLALGVPADWGRAVPDQAFLVSPIGFRRADESARDNVYMAESGFDAERALTQHADLVAAVRGVLPATVFPGSAETPDAVFPNNVFASVPRRLIIGAMKHPVRQREAARTDLPAWFEAQFGASVQRLDAPGVVAELTGPLIIDRGRGLGFCGMSERVNEAGLAAMDEAFGLRAMYAFDLVPGEYHTNVVMSVLAGRALVLHRASVADPAAADAIASLYGDAVIWLSDEEKAAFAGNCIALSDRHVFLSARAYQSLAASTRQRFLDLRFELVPVALDEIEKAGGSLRCCIGEIYC
ncbi:MAG: amidinotransferase [Ahniella sp.]|nr:amidinotransferase [Ahniella sp.]